MTTNLKIVSTVLLMLGERELITPQVDGSSKVEDKSKTTKNMILLESELGQANNLLSKIQALGYHNGIQTKFTAIDSELTRSEGKTITDPGKDKESWENSWEYVLDQRRKDECGCLGCRPIDADIPMDKVEEIIRERLGLNSKEETQQNIEKTKTWAAKAIEIFEAPLLISGEAHIMKKLCHMFITEGDFLNPDLFIPILRVVHRDKLFTKVTQNLIGTDKPDIEDAAKLYKFIATFAGLEILEGNNETIMIFNLLQEKLEAIVIRETRFEIPVLLSYIDMRMKEADESFR